MVVNTPGSRFTPIATLECFALLPTFYPRGFCEMVARRGRHSKNGVSIAQTADDFAGLAMAWHEWLSAAEIDDGNAPKKRGCYYRRLNQRAPRTICPGVSRQRPCSTHPLQPKSPTTKSCSVRQLKRGR